MKHSTKFLLAVALISGSLVSGTSYASPKEVVFDSSGNIVRSTLSGQCVHTRWDAETNRCEPEQTIQPATTFSGQERSFITFFDYDQSVLTPNAKDIIRTLFSSTKSAEAVHFDLTGHADRVGSDAYNIALSKKRALSVKSELMRLGVSESDISVSWKGESDPLVPTEDGIKEPQNRRVEINVASRISGMRN